MIKMNAFAKQVGISPVYLSYLENSKRPAPSEKVLKTIIDQLDLNSYDAEKIILLAAETHHKPAIPMDIIEYIHNNEHVIYALRKAKEYSISEDAWLKFIDQASTEHSSD